MGNEKQGFAQKIGYQQKPKSKKNYLIRKNKIMLMFTKDFREIFSAEILSITGGLFAGTLLAFAVGKLELVPGILILLPGFLEMRGNISGSLSARLSSGLHLGVVKPKIEKNRAVKGNVIASVILVILVSAVLGLVAYFANMYFFGVNNAAIIFIALFAGIFSNVIEIPITILITFWLFRHGHDPNNIMGPYVTTIGDVVSISSLLIAIVII